MTRLPLISVVMLTYNGEQYLREQINSILTQDYPHLEIIVSDDHSSDDTLAILESYKDDPRLQIYRNNQNVGFRRNFFYACTHARGQYIALADQDDIWLPHKLSALQSAIGKNLLAYSNSQLMTDDGTLLPTLLIEKQRITPIIGSNFRGFYFANCVAAHNTLFRREIMETLPAVPDTHYHDSWLAFNCALRGSITYINQPLVYYRQHLHSVTGKAVAKKNTHWWQRIIEKHQRQCHKLDNKISALEKMLSAQTQIGREDPLLKELIKEYRRHNQHFINTRLLRLLWNNYEQLFAILPHKNRIGMVLKESTGTWHYRSLISG